MPLITISVDGVALAPFTPGNPATGGLTHIAVRFGDNSGVREDTGKVSVDDFAIYSDTTGFVEVFSDDFESYSDGDSLDTDNPASPYNSSTSEATVEEVEVVGSAGPGTPGNQFAEIRDTDTTDTGELRYKLDAPLFAGRLEVAVKRLDDAFGDLDAAITLYTSTGSTSSATADLKIKDNAYEIRSPKTTLSDLPLTLDEFMDVIMTWEYPQGSDNPVIVISINGVTLDPITTAAAAAGGVDSIAFRFGDNGKTALEETAIFSVDDIAIYSDITGDTLVFEDDFESYSDGDSLDDDNVASPYNDRTSEATVGTEPELVEE